MIPFAFAAGDVVHVLDSEGLIDHHVWTIVDCRHECVRPREQKRRGRGAFNSYSLRRVGVGTIRRFEEDQIRRSFYTTTIGRGPDVRMTIVN